MTSSIVVSSGAGTAVVRGWLGRDLVGIDRRGCDARRERYDEEHGARQRVTALLVQRALIG